MALKSYLFSNDKQLQAAAVSNPAHVMRGAKGDHVAKIQYALSRITGEHIDTDGIFGAQTAAAVLAFKTKHQIINRSYQSQPDDIVGIMTMAALDEMLFQLEQSEHAGGLITCGVRMAPRS